MKRRKNKHMGSNFDDFLQKEGVLEESQASAAKKVIVFQIKNGMKKEKK